MFFFSFLSFPRDWDSKIFRVIVSLWKGKQKPGNNQKHLRNAIGRLTPQGLWKLDITRCFFLCVLSDFQFVRCENSEHNFEVKKSKEKLPATFPPITGVARLRCFSTENWDMVQLTSNLEQCHISPITQKLYLSNRNEWNGEFERFDMAEKSDNFFDATRSASVSRPWNWVEFKKKITGTKRISKSYRYYRW